MGNDRRWPKLTVDRNYLRRASYHMDRQKTVRANAIRVEVMAAAFPPVDEYLRDDPEYS